MIHGGICDDKVDHKWIIIKLISIKEVKDLLLGVTENDWLYRRQSGRYEKLIPSLDRNPYQSLSGSDKINMERKRIDYFRENVKYFEGEGERPSKTPDMIALLVLRHYGVLKQGGGQFSFTKK